MPSRRLFVCICYKVKNTNSLATQQFKIKGFIKLKCGFIDKNEYKKVKKKSIYWPFTKMKKFEK